MFILGPIGAIYKGLTEDLKSKANNETVLLYMKQQKETDDRQWKAIEQQIQEPPMIHSPSRVTVNTEPKPVILEQKEGLPPSYFLEYKDLSPEEKLQYRQAYPEYRYPTK